MSRQLMNLHHVPDDEANAVRELLDGAGFDWYEIAPNRWGVSPGAIWISENDDYDAAKALLTQFHAERARDARAGYEEAKRSGATPTLIGVARKNPMKFVMALICIALMLGLAALPVFLVGGG
ncbi:MAG: DUF6164 family protein [Dokdonella sp.]